MAEGERRYRVSGTNRERPWLKIEHVVWATSESAAYWRVARIREWEGKVTLDRWTAERV